MNKLIVMFGALTFLTACGGGTAAAPGVCASHPFVGTRNQTGGVGNVFVFAADCSGTGSYCESTFTYPNATAATGAAVVTISSANVNNAGCAVGAVTCGYAIDGGTMAISCDEGATSSVYTKQ